MRPSHILYCGDSPAGGPANYLLGILKSISAKTFHVPPSERLKETQLARPLDAIILSDYSRKQVSEKSERLIQKKVRNGAGLLMVGGWGSFSGPFGGWRGSLVEDLLPVQCLNGDDRLHFPAGAHIFQNRNHAMFKGIYFDPSPAVVGLNRFLPKSSAKVLLSAKPIEKKRGSLSYGREVPFFVISEKEATRTAALATDLAPHWCGGLVDWGKRRIKLPVQTKVSIEVGEAYVHFVAAILRWLTGNF